MAGTWGWQGQLGIDTAATATLRYDYHREDVVCDENFIDMNGLRGTMSHAVERVRAGNRRVHGPIRMQPTALELSNLLPWILHGAPSGSGTVTFPLADAMPTARYVTVDRGFKVPAYNGCQVDRCSITGREGEPLEWTLDIVGIDETLGTAASFPSLSIDISTQPFIFTDLVLSVNSATTKVKDFQLTIDWNIDKNRFFNQQTLTDVRATDLKIGLTLHPPYGDAGALYNTGAAGVPAVATFTGAGTQVLVFTFVKVCFPRKSPFTEGKQEIMLPLEGIAYKSSTTDPLVTTLHQ